MTKKLFSVAAMLLKEASDEFSNHGCNDWEFPYGWTRKEKEEVVKQMYEDNGDPENFNPEHLSVPDWWIMSWLAKQLRKI